MKNYYQPMKISPETYKGQFILTKNFDLIPECWSCYQKGQWCLGVLGLPALVVENGLGQSVGWCLGYPLRDKKLWAEKISIQNMDDGSINMQGVEQFYNDTGGKFILILLHKNEGKIFLDPYGSLAAVFSTTEQTVASTTTWIARSNDWDEEIINALGMPERDRWFPAGLTPKIGVKRLLPNHCLDLNDWSVARHWPNCSSELVVDDDAQKGVSKIISCIKHNIEAVANCYPIHLSLTAGRDSRMLLACAREFLPRVLFFTFAEKRETMDMHIASMLAKRFKLNHSFIPVQLASEEEKIRWFNLIGHSVSGAIMRVHKTLQKLDRNRVLIPGIGGEVGRSFFWRPSDGEDTTLSANDLLSRTCLPNNDRILRETEKWLSELSGFNAFNILDLFFIEQRIGCWAGPQHYGNTSSIFELSVFNHRKIFTAMLRLPYKYRVREELTNDVIRNSWPELLELPFNKFTGIKNCTNSTKSFCLNIARKIKSSAFRR